MEKGKTKRQYGLWSSPVSPAGLAGGVRFSDVQWSADGVLVWREERSGTGVIVVRERDDAPRDLTEGLNVRARVTYGGGDFGLGGGSVVFAEMQSGRLYRQPITGGEASPITPGFGFAAAPVVSPDGRWVAYIHSYEGRDAVAVVDLGGRSWPRVLASDHDFFMQPVWSPDGSRLAWVAWDHPRMPWDGATLYVADLDLSGDLPRVAGEPREIAGGDDVAIFQPEFLPSGDRIAYVSDESGWGRLVVRDLATGATSEVSADEFDLGTPAWIQGLRTYALFGDGSRALVTVNGEARITAAVGDLDTGKADPFVELAEYDAVLQPAVDPASGSVAAIVSGPAIPPRVVEARPSDRRARVVRRGGAENIAPEALSSPEHISWASAVSHSAHGLFYPPASERFESDGAPPLVVMVHGGPTSQAIAAWSPQVQFLTTRGYAVLAVNHRGSTGYGRDFMTALRGNWGLLDVEDSVSGAKALAREGRVDGDRMAIMGGSAGGFTVLQTMIDHPTAFAAGVCLYGVSNQFTLAAETHKFESHYTDSLLGPLPDAAAVYRERSPQFRASEIRRPLAIFQGAIDEVVPKNQSEAIVAALERSGTPHEYHVYEGEGHGWRRAETIEAFYTALDRFLRQWLVYA